MKLFLFDVRKKYASRCKHRAYENGDGKNREYKRLPLKEEYKFTTGKAYRYNEAITKDVDKIVYESHLKNLDETHETHSFRKMKNHHASKLEIISFQEMYFLKKQNTKSGNPAEQFGVDDSVFKRIHNPVKRDIKLCIQMPTESFLGNIQDPFGTMILIRASSSKKKKYVSKNQMSGKRPFVNTHNIIQARNNITTKAVINTSCEYCLKGITNKEYSPEPRIKLPEIYQLNVIPIYSLARKKRTQKPNTLFNVKRDEMVGKCQVKSNFLQNKQIRLKKKLADDKSDAYNPVQIETKIENECQARNISDTTKVKYICNNIKVKNKGSCDCQVEIVSSSNIPISKQETHQTNIKSFTRRKATASCDRNITSINPQGGAAKTRNLSRQAKISQKSRMTRNAYPVMIPPPIGLKKQTAETDEEPNYTLLSKSDSRKFSSYYRKE